jgi:hypothetical protein
MAFTIYVRNDGDTGTVRVYQKINNNEEKLLLDQTMEVDARVSVQAFRTDSDGDDRGEFAWEHGGSGLSGQENVRAGDELLVH